jgi:anti-anti-sigma factor
MNDPVRTSKPPILIELGGDIDMANAEALGDSLCAAIDRARCEIVVDLTEVPFLDSSAMAMMIRVHRAAAGCESRVTWRGVQPFPARALAIAGLDRTLLFDPCATPVNNS